jgi:hypothetical protein
MSKQQQPQDSQETNVHLAAPSELARAKHTAGPWQRSGVRIKLGGEDCLQVGPDGFAVAFLPIGRTPQEHAGAIADARRIVQCWNSHDELMEALQMALQIGDQCSRGFLGAFQAKARAAIRKAESAA